MVDLLENFVISMNYQSNAIRRERNAEHVPSTFVVIASRLRQQKDVDHVARGRFDPHFFVLRSCSDRDMCIFDFSRSFKPPSGGIRFFDDD